MAAVSLEVHPPQAGTLSARRYPHRPTAFNVALAFEKFINRLDRDAYFIRPVVHGQDDFRLNLFTDLTGDRGFNGEEAADGNHEHINFADGFNLSVRKQVPEVA